MAGGDGLRGVEEDLAPGVPHRLQLGEPLPGVAVQGLLEEGDETVPYGRVEGLGRDGRVRPLLRVGHAGRDTAVGPFGQLAGGHLVQGDGDGVPLGVRVVGAAGDDVDEGVEVAVGARVGALRRVAGEGEVDEDELAGAVGADADGDVVGLDVAVPDALALQEVDGSEEVVAVRLQLVHLEAAVVAELAGDRLLTAARAVPTLGALSVVVALVADVLQGQDGTAADTQRLGFDEADDAGVGAQTSHGLGLAGEDLAAAVGEGDLQHGQRAGPAGFGLEVADEERAAGGAGAEAAADLPPAGEHVTGDGLQRVLVASGPVVLVARPLRSGGRLDRGGEGVLDDLQQLEELVHAGQPLARPVGGGGLHQVVHVLRQAVHQGAGAQALPASRRASSSA